MKDFTQHLNSLNLQQLQELLKEVKNYKNLSKQLGNRGIQAYNRNKLGIPKLLVEHFTHVSPDIAWEQASRVYKSIFDIEVDRNNVDFKSKESLKGGIKVYMDDKMVDLSYSKIEKQIQ